MTRQQRKTDALRETLAEYIMDGGEPTVYDAYDIHWREPGLHDGETVFARDVMPDEEDIEAARKLAAQWSDRRKS